jgi:hypothetical protein
MENWVPTLPRSLRKVGTRGLKLSVYHPFAKARKNGRPRESGLDQNRADIACTMEDSDDLKRVLLWIVNDQIVWIRLDNPKAAGNEVRSLLVLPANGESARKAHA